MVFEHTEKPLIDLLTFGGYIAYASPEKVAFERELKALGCTEGLFNCFAKVIPSPV